MFTSLRRIIIAPSSASPVRIFARLLPISLQSRTRLELLRCESGPTSVLRQRVAHFQPCHFLRKQLLNCSVLFDMNASAMQDCPLLKIRAFTAVLSPSPDSR